VGFVVFLVVVFCFVFFFLFVLGFFFFLWVVWVFFWCLVFFLGFGFLGGFLGGSRPGNQGAQLSVPTFYFEGPVYLNVFAKSSRLNR